MSKRFSDSVNDRLEAMRLDHRDTGGLVFPLFRKTGDGMIDPGMTLRDYFAGQIMSGLVSDVFNTSKAWEEMAEAENLDPHAVMARVAYAYADAMIKRRAK